MITKEQRQTEFHLECNPDGTMKCCTGCGTCKPLREFKVFDEPKFDPDMCSICEDERSETSHDCLVCDITRCGQSMICGACERGQEQESEKVEEQYVERRQRPRKMHRRSDPKKLMVFKNGMLDCSQGIDTWLYELTPSLFTYNVFPYSFDPSARSRLYEDTVNDIFNGDQERIRVWHQWLGYSLISDQSQEKLMFLIGGRRSGKGTLLSVLRGILGENQCVSTTYRSVGSRFGLAGLENKLAATIGDARMPSKTEANAALEAILQITGGDSVTIEPKFRPQHDAKLNCRFTVVANELPTFADSARALVARSIILNFPNDYFGREDVTLKRRLKEEANQGKLINYALDGLKDLRKQGYFTITKSSEAYYEAFEEITAPVSAFVKQCCTLRDDNEAYSTKDMLFEAWAAWCKLSNRQVGSAAYFARHLYQACPAIKNFRSTDNSGKRIQVFRGIVLQEWVYDEYLGRPK